LDVIFFLYAINDASDSELMCPPGFDVFLVDILQWFRLWMVIFELLDVILRDPDYRLQGIDCQLIIYELIAADSNNCVVDLRFRGCP
jgi:hypothetical protein